MSIYQINTMKKGDEAIDRFCVRAACLLIVFFLVVFFSSKIDIRDSLAFAECLGTNHQLKITQGDEKISIRGGGQIYPNEQTSPFSLSRALSLDMEDKGRLFVQSFANQGPQRWLIYTDSAFGFSIQYPNSYVILPESMPLPASFPQMVHRVRFQDQQRASGQFVDREPPQFSITIFELDPPVSLFEWLHSKGLLPHRATIVRTHLDGVADGWRIRLSGLMAPNEFYFFRAETYVYRLTPLGPHGQEMINSFKLFPRD